ncbi:Fic family protein [Synechococcus sp. CS-1331]|nr:Fic family protein [Synechococcus sp. CS-1331]NQW38671.1 Fic family protein [Cyanobacteria bacterium bin.275]
MPPCRKRIGPLSGIHPFSDGNKRGGFLVAVVFF